MTYDKITFPARVILGLLPEGVPLTGAEVGVHRGHTAASLLARRPSLALYLVDSWGMVGADVEGRSGENVFSEALAEVRKVRSRVRTYTEGYTSLVSPNHEVSCIVLAGDSTRMASRVPDASLDFAHIDADHRYPKVLEDIRAWWPKVKPGGFLCGHDIDNHPPEFEPWDVRRAVEEFCAEQRVNFEVFRPEMEWVIRKP